MGIQTKGVHPKNPYELMTIPKVWLNPIQLLGWGHGFSDCCEATDSWDGDFLTAGFIMFVLVIEPSFRTLRFNNMIWYDMIPIYKLNMYRYRYLKTKYTDRYTGIPHPKHGFLMTKNMGSTWINGTNRHPKDRMDSTKQCFFRPPKLSSFDPYIHITYIYMYIYMYIHI